MLSDIGCGLVVLGLADVNCGLVFDHVQCVLGLEDVGCALDLDDVWCGLGWILTGGGRGPGVINVKVVTG